MNQNQWLAIGGTLKPTHRQMAALAMAAALIAGWFAYAPGLGGAFLLDDTANLADLQSIDDGDSALTFILSGSAGPLGRPLALATFVPQASAWGTSAEAFLTVNVLLHLVNAALLGWVLYRLSIARKAAQDNALFASVVAAAIWLLMPLLASSSLMIVQRMTTLSAFFVLLGLAGYLHARSRIERRPVGALVGMSVSLGTGTILAAFSKENGALLPVLVLVVEATLLTQPQSVRRPLWRAWAGIALVLPTLLILGYLISRVPYSEEIVLRRGFSGWERLLTEARVLWQYLYHAFVPQPGSFGPFHDGHAVARTLFNPVTFIAVTGWIAAVGAALTVRRRYPLFAFAILWFVAGHLLESTVIPLELYFEHRNYLPIIGPVYALAFAIAGVPAPKRRLARGGIVAYGLVNAFVLAGVTSLWGDPPMAARYWQAQFPESVRAATNAATFQIQEGGPAQAMNTLHAIAEDRPEVAYLKIQELNLACLTAPDADHDRLIAELNSSLDDVDFTHSAGTMLSQLLTTVANVDCNGVDSGTVRALAVKLLSNPRYSINSSYNQLHHKLMARIARSEGHYDETIRHLHLAMEYGTSAELNLMMVTTHADSGQFDLARAYIRSALANKPLHPMSRYVWTNSLRELMQYVDELERRFELKSRR